MVVKVMPVSYSADLRRRAIAACVAVTIGYAGSNDRVLGYLCLIQPINDR